MTAEHWVNQQFSKQIINEDIYASKQGIIEAMIIFTKLHREAILKEIAEYYLYYLEGDEGSERLDEKKFFKEAYPLNLIK